MDSAVLALLEECGLSGADLDPPPRGLELFGYRSPTGELIAMIGLEHVAGEALLRSLAVSRAWRGRALGDRLIAHAERRAAESGCTQLHLLTESAVAYFENRGYKYGERDRAPEAVRATMQFRALCPASAYYMTKSATGKGTT